jgi:hypothetical protein
MYSSKDTGLVNVEGHIKIYDPQTNEIFVNKRNAIHYENFSYGLAQAMSNQNAGFISSMVFGNGGTRIDPTGIITYRTPNTIGPTAQLYNQTYGKYVDARNSASPDPARNYMEVRHLPGAYYSDILVSCLLDFGEPADQAVFDNSTNSDGAYIFDELGLKGHSVQGVSEGLLLTHVIFHPVQKSLNRMIQIDYTVRVQSLSSGI